MTKFFLTTLPERLGKFEAILKSREEGKSFFFGDKVNKQDKSVPFTHSRVVTFWRRTHPTDLKLYPSPLHDNAISGGNWLWNLANIKDEKKKKRNSAAIYVIGA